jgi:hypothetical protein
MIGICIVLSLFAALTARAQSADTASSESDSSADAAGSNASTLDLFAGLY